MSTLNYPPLADFALKCRDRLGLSHLVETGTFQGVSTAWAAQYFSSVTTIDIRDTYLGAAKSSCYNYDNVTYLLGDSRALLPQIVETEAKPLMFWLDAHNAGHLFGEGPDDCPLIEELEAVLSTRLPHGVMIDDAHCFMPPVPYDPNEWPEMWRIKALAARYGYLTGVAHDCIAIVPDTMADVLSQFVGHNLASLIGLSAMPRRRFSANVGVFMAKRIPLKCRAHMVQGDPPPLTYNPDLGNPAITEYLSETQYGKMLVPAFDSNQTVALRGGWALAHNEIEMLVGLIQHRPPGAVFADIGANVGTFSFALQPYCSAVHAFEAQRLIFYMLCGSVALNGWNNVFCYNCCVSDRQDAVELPQFDYGMRGSFGSIEFGPEQLEDIGQPRQNDPKKIEYIPTIPLDQFTFNRLDMLKMDVEGGELKALSGAKSTIMLHRPIMLVEHGKVGAVPLLRKLHDLGYTDIREVGGDYLAIPEGGI